jgi:hypothetical protein
MQVETVDHRRIEAVAGDRRGDDARGPRRVARDGFDHVTLHLVLAGRMMLEVPGAIRAVEAEDEHARQPVGDDLGPQRARQAIDVGAAAVERAVRYLRGPAAVTEEDRR